MPPVTRQAQGVPVVGVSLLPIETFVVSERPGMFVGPLDEEKVAAAHCEHDAIHATVVNRCNITAGDNHRPYELDVFALRQLLNGLFGKQHERRVVAGL